MLKNKYESVINGKVHPLNFFLIIVLLQYFQKRKQMIKIFNSIKIIGF